MSEAEGSSSLTSSRKNSHISVCLNEQVEYYAPESSGFASLRFDHDALPEISKKNIDLTTTLFGKRLAAPLIIGAMTGGTEKAGEINRRLALAAERCQIGFALGSQRPLIEKPELRSSFAVRDKAPGIPLVVGNVGAVQLNYGVTVADIRRLIEAVGADAFNFHLNPLQEAIQPEGDTDFSDLLPQLTRMIPEIPVPVILKEVGSGISETTALKICGLPIAGIETAGVGGTSWSKIESLRSNNTIQRSTGELFARWGVTTAESIATTRRVLPHLKIIGSGGIRNGIEIAKAIALGADAVAFALPMLKAAEQSTEAAIEALEQAIEELRTAMFVVGAPTVDSLRSKVLRPVLDLTSVAWNRQARG